MYNKKLIYRDVGIKFLRFDDANVTLSQGFQNELRGQGPFRSSSFTLRHNEEHKWTRSIDSNHQVFSASLCRSNAIDGIHF